MKPILILSLAGTLISAFNAQAASLADVRMHSTSVQILRGYGAGQFQFYSIDFTTSQSGVNHELLMLEPGGYSHGAGIFLNDHLFDESIPGVLNVDIPAFSDANANGFDDFFEVSQGFGNRTTSGGYQFQFGGGGGGVSATWSRSAGSATGTLLLTLQGWGTYTHTFRILEFTGPFSYTPGANRIEGSIALQQTDSPETTLGGELDFIRNSANRFNQLTNQLTSWTNAFEQTFEVIPRIFQRDVPFAPTNYYGYILFADGDPNTGDPDYQLWLMAIDDLNDTDHDGIPNLSDDAALPQARRPSLTLANTGTNLLLTISGDVGHVHQIQSHTNLATTNWTSALSVTLTNDPHRVLVPYPATSPRFWRAIAQ